MDIEEFHSSWINDIMAESANNLTSPHNEFIEDAIAKLVDSGELDEDAQNNIDHFEGIGRRGAKIIIDSFCYDPVDNTYTIIINSFSSQPDITTITNTDIDTLYKNMLRLVEASIDNYILDPRNQYEVSTAGYRLAKDLNRRYNNKEIDKFRFHIITDRILSQRVKVIKKEPISDIPVDLNVWDLNRFYNLYTSQRGKEDLNVDTSGEIGGGIKCIEATSCDSYKSYLATISGKFLADIYLQYGSRLLEGNVRSFLSARGKINKGIRLTILNDPNMFFTFNNGIAITATDIDTETMPDGSLRITRIKDMQIINGGQTTASVANVMIQDKADEQLQAISVPTKITVLNDPGLADEIIPHISRYANSQNKVNEADFFSNHPYHVKLENLSRTIPAPAVDGNQYQTYWFYERARGQYDQAQMKLSRAERKKFQTINPKNQLLRKTDIAKYINTFACFPDRVSRGAQTNMRFFASDITKLAEKDPDLPWLNKKYYTDLIAKAIIFKSTERIVSDQQWYKENKAYRANIVTYSLAMIMNKLKKDYQNLTINWQRIWDHQALYPEFEQQIARIAKLAYDQITRDDRENENVTEWCKKETCAKRALTVNFDLDEDFLKTLVFIDDEIYQDDIAAKDQRENNNLKDNIVVLSQAPGFWRKFYDFCRKEDLVNYKEASCIEIAANLELTGKMPSDKQCSVIMGAYRRLEKDAFLPQELKIV